MPNSYFVPIDIYCERLGPGFWAEPLNALSNASFIVAAWLLWRLARSRAAGVGWQAGWLIGLVAAIGVGSFLFHTLAVRWAMLADVIPISIYQLSFIGLYCRTVARLSAMRVVVCLAAFIAASAAFGMLPQHWFNGSLAYGPALVFITCIGVYHRLSGKHEPQLMLLAAGLFAVSLTFRSLDMALCEQLTVGTHVVWHLLNGLLLYLTTRAFLVNPEPGSLSG